MKILNWFKTLFFGEPKKTQPINPLVDNTISIKRTKPTQSTVTKMPITKAKRILKIPNYGVNDLENKRQDIRKQYPNETDLFIETMLFESLVNTTIFTPTDSTPTEFDGGFGGGDFSGSGSGGDWGDSGSSSFDSGSSYE